MGGSLGVAVFGAIFASRLSSELTALPAEAASHLSGGVNVNPTQIHALPDAVRHDYLVAFVNSLQPVFLLGAVLATVAFALTWRLKEIPLRETLLPDAEPSAEAIRTEAATALPTSN
jgi:hypothetical protein